MNSLPLITKLRRRIRALLVRDFDEIWCYGRFYAQTDGSKILEAYEKQFNYKN